MTGPTSDTSAVIQVSGLTKSYGDVRAVAGIDLRIARGEVFAMLGPNGAGKTTTVEILEGYRRRDGGQVTVLGLDPGKQQRRLKAQIGIVLQSTGVHRGRPVPDRGRDDRHVLRLLSAPSPGR
jgi:ABC-2 type transport system ATP-binding protein